MKEKGIKEKRFNEDDDNAFQKWRKKKGEEKKEKEENKEKR